MNNQIACVSVAVSGVKVSPHAIERVDRLHKILKERFAFKTAVSSWNLHVSIQKPNRVSPDPLIPKRFVTKPFFAPVDPVDVFVRRDFFTLVDREVSAGFLLKSIVGIPLFSRILFSKISTSPNTARSTERDSNPASNSMPPLDFI